MPYASPKAGGHRQEIPPTFTPCWTADTHNLLVSLDSQFALQVSGRQLQSYGGTIHEKWGGLLQAPMPTWLSGTLKDINVGLDVFGGPANHVLLNAYEPGEGILVCLTWLVSLSSM